MAGRCGSSNYSLRVWETEGSWRSWCSIMCNALQVVVLQRPEDILIGSTFWSFYHLPSIPSWYQVLNQCLWGALKIETSTCSSVTAVRNYGNSVVLDLEARRSKIRMLARLYSLWPQGKSTSLLYINFSVLFSLTCPRKFSSMLKSVEEQLQIAFFCLSLVHDSAALFNSPTPRSPTFLLFLQGYLYVVNSELYMVGKCPLAKSNSD